MHYAIMHLAAPYIMLKLNPYSESNINLILTLILKPSLNPQTKL